MAGSYIDVPSRRMGWDADGTVAGRIRTDFSEAFVEFDSTTKVEMNDEDEIGFITGTGQPIRYVTTVYPELREIDGIFYAFGAGTEGAPSTVDTSGDTTNGIDGTWTQRIADLANFVVVGVNYRTNITSMAVSSVRGTRIQISASALNDQQGRALHIYGAISPGETPDRLLFLDPDNADAEFTKPLDYGDVPRGQSLDDTFKVKNNSATLTANTVQITAEALYLGSGAWYTFSSGGAFQATLNIGNLGPGATQLITIRQIVPAAETLGLHAGRVKVSTASWS